MCVQCKIQILRLARGAIASRESEFICLAIGGIAMDIDAAEIGNELIRDIERAIHPHNTIGSWLIHNAGIPGHEIFVDQNIDSTWPRLVEYRCRWIDDMIETLESGGEL